VEVVYGVREHELNASLGVHSDCCTEGRSRWLDQQIQILLKITPRRRHIDLVLASNREEHVVLRIDVFAATRAWQPQRVLARRQVADHRSNSGDCRARVPWMVQVDLEAQVLHDIHRTAYC